MGENIYSEQRKGMSPEVQGLGGGSVAINWKRKGPQSPFEAMSKVLSTVLESQAQEEQKRQEKLKKQADMYKVLRDSGYDPKSAYEAVQKNQFPNVAPEGTSLEEEKQRAEIENKKAQSKKFESEAARGGMRPQSEQEMLKNKTKKQRALMAIKTGRVFDPRTGQDSFVPLETKEDVLGYVATLGVDMEDAEIQNAIDEKFSAAPAAIGSGSKITPDQGKVLMKKPDGSTVRIKSADVEAALQAGYKRLKDA